MVNTITSLAFIASNNANWLKKKNKIMDPIFCRKVVFPFSDMPQDGRNSLLLNNLLRLQYREKKPNSAALCQCQQHQLLISFL